MRLIIMSLLTHTQVDRAEICTKILSMKRRFHQYTFYLLKIVAYSRMKLFSSPKTLKTCDLQPCPNKRTFRTKALGYGDDKMIFEFLEL